MENNRAETLEPGGLRFGDTEIMRGLLAGTNFGLADTSNLGEKHDRGQVGTIDARVLMVGPPEVELAKLGR